MKSKFISFPDENCESKSKNLEVLTSLDLEVLGAKNIGKKKNYMVFAS